MIERIPPITILAVATERDLLGEVTSVLIDEMALERFGAIGLAGEVSLRALMLLSVFSLRREVSPTQPWD